MITVILRMRVRPEKRRELVQTILAMIDPERKQNGCLIRDFYQDARSEDSFLLLEVWKTRKSLDRHFRSDWFHILLGTRNLLQEEPQIELGSLSRSDVVVRSTGPGHGPVDT